MRIHHYPDILAENLYLYSRGNNVHVATEISESERQAAAGLQCSKYAFEGMGFGDNIFNELFKECIDYLSKLFLGSTNGNYYLVRIENNAERSQAILRLTTDNFHNYIHFILDSRNCFVISPSQNASTISDLHLTFTSRPGDTVASINYLKLVLDYCPQGFTIFKISGDGGDNYIAIDAFTKP